MARNVRDALCYALKQLVKDDLKTFRNTLNDWEIEKGHQRIPRGMLQDRDAEDVVDLIQDYYTLPYGAQLTVKVLKAINQRQVALELQEELAKVFTVTKHFIDRHREDLIQGVSVVNPILDNLLEHKLLTNEHCDRIQNTHKRQEKMRELYSYIKCWSNIEKDMLYESLKAHNATLFKDLEDQDKEWIQSFSPEVIVTFFLDELNQWQFKQFKSTFWDLCDKDSHLIPQRLLQSADRTTTAMLLIVIYRKEEALTMATQILKRIKETDLAVILQNWITLLGGRQSKSFHEDKEQQCGKQLAELPVKIKCLSETLEGSSGAESTTGDWEVPFYVRSELTCSICLDILSDPTTLTCGHNFCMECIEETWDSQGKGKSSCPNCKRSFIDRPELEINRSVREVTNYCKSTKSKPRTSDLHCTYCLESPVAAIKSCLWCESSLCDAHLSVHSQEPAHILVEPTTDFKKRKCLLHNKILDFYCLEDATCICSSCVISKEHRGHQVEEIKSAAENKKICLQLDQIKLKDHKAKLEKCLDRCMEMASPDQTFLEELLKALELPVPEEELSQATVSTLIQKAEEKVDQLFLEIESVEESCQKTDPFLVLKPEIKHFVDRHCEDLILRVNLVDSILGDLLLESLLTKEHYDQISSQPTNPKKMRELYRVVRVWSNAEKDRLSIFLKKHEPHLINDLEDQEKKRLPSYRRRKKQYNQDVEAGSSKLLAEKFDLQPDLSKSLEEVVMATDQPLGSSSSDLQEMDCKLCGKKQDPEDILVSPIMEESRYRLDLKSAGRFLCSETGIKFQVTGPVTIEYEPDSWYNYMEFLRHGGSEVLGPLFSIKAPQGPKRVSAMYLPHYLCLKELGEDTSWIKCAHFKDGNLSVETPARVLPFYILLENPSFSSFGTLCHSILPNVVARYFPLHGQVLLYFKVMGKKCVEYKVHLYLLPEFTPISKEFHQEKERNGFRKVDKPERTQLVYTNKNYTVRGPKRATINPTELAVWCACPLKSFTDIIMKANVKMINLTVEQPDTKDEIWKCFMTEGEIEDLLPKTPDDGSFSRSQETPAVTATCSKDEKPFVDRHRAELIQRVTTVDEILDKVLDAGLMSYEAYDAARAEDTNPDKMRMLYDSIKALGTEDKEKVYNILKEHRAPLTRDLERCQNLPKE